MNILAIFDRAAAQLGNLADDLGFVKLKIVLDGQRVDVYGTKHTRIKAYK